MNTNTIARNPCAPLPPLPKVSVAIVEAEVEEVAAAVSEAEEVTEEVATVEAAVAGRGTSVGLAEEPVVAEDADPIDDRLPYPPPFWL